MDSKNKFPGFRVLIANSDFIGDQSEGYTGIGNVEDAVECDCPNCTNTMYPAFNLNLNFPEVDLHSVIEWKESSLHILFCPFCALYMAPYWLRHKKDNIEIVGGYRDGGEIIQEIETPYACRQISLLPLADEDYPDDDSSLQNLLERRREPGVYHQLGGTPIKGQNEHLNCCDCGCEMKFIGVLDYDDLNVPLYEQGHSPVALIIGDYDALNLYSCIKCAVVGVKWVK